MFINKNVGLNNSNTKTAMTMKISIFVICVEAIIYLLLHNVHHCTIKKKKLIKKKKSKMIPCLKTKSDKSACANIFLELPLTNQVGHYLGMNAT